LPFYCVKAAQRRLWQPGSPRRLNAAKGLAAPARNENRMTRKKAEAIARLDIFKNLMSFSITLRRHQHCAPMLNDITKKENIKDVRL
jgi:hypothetical protein